MKYDDEKNLLNKSNMTIELCKRGWTNEEIAKVLNISLGEVELILELRNVEKPNINDSPVRRDCIIEEISNILNISNDEAILLLDQENVKKSSVIATLEKKDEINDKDRIQLDNDVTEVLNILYNDGLTWDFDEIKVNGKHYKIENNNKLKSKFILSPGFPEDSEYYGIRRILDICFNMQRDLVEVENYVPAWQPLSGGGSRTVLLKRNIKWEEISKNVWIS